MGIPVERQLFNNEMFLDFEKRKRETIKSDIDRMSDDSLLLPDQAEMLSYLVENYSLEEIYLDTDNIDKFHRETKNEFTNIWGECGHVDSLTIYWKMPFSGPDGLLFIQPSRHIMSTFIAVVENNYLTISDYASITEIQNDPKIIENKLQVQLDRFSTQISYLNADIRLFNNSLKKFISDIMEKRSEKSDIVQKALEVMNIPLKRNQDAPSIIPLRKKLVRPSIPIAKREQSYEISDEDYSHILGVIRHVGATFERVRKTFCKMDEEELRDVILANLNGHYMGLATGETFRNEGKTDINIEFENRAAFVGECKIWKGDKIFQKTLDQLIGYLTWRDNKNAMIFFNKKNKGFKAVQDKINELISGLKGCSQINTKAGEWEFKLNTTDYEKTIHVFLFDIYKDKESNESEE